MISYVLTEEAETANAQINRALSSYRSSTNFRSTRLSRSRLPAWRQDHAAEQRDATLLRIFSITESFCTDRLLNEVEKELHPFNSDTHSKVWDAASTNAVSSLQNLSRHYKEWLGIKKMDWSYINNLAIARNAIMHGAGYLTRQQIAKRESNVSRLSSIGIHVADDRVTVTDDNLRDISAKCIRHIESVDETVATRT